MRAVAGVVFGAKAQVVVGGLCFVVGVAAWVYGRSLNGEALLRFVYDISMFFGLVACYAIVATGLGFRATERVEEHVAGGDRP